jgi:hypothetical protein
MSQRKKQKTTDVEHNFVISAKLPTKASTITFKKILSPELHNTLLHITNDVKFYSEEVVVKVSEIYKHYTELKKLSNDDMPHLSHLCTVLEEVYGDDIKLVQKMKEDKLIGFEQLNLLLPIGSCAVAKSTLGHLVGGTIMSLSTHFNGKINVTYITIASIKSNGETFVKKQVTYTIDEFSGLTKIENLSIRPMTADDRKKLIERGKKYVEFGIGHKYLAYSGNMFVETWFGPHLYNATGRIMVDIVGHKRCNPNYASDNEKKICNEYELNDNDFSVMWPFLPAFSFASKRWGSTIIDNIKQIKFDDDAFDCLVMDKEKKEITKLLIINSKVGFTDVISGKSGGCIFLLHGPPGTGKTLTAEAISELLHEPLYPVTSGELGTNPTEVEEKLSSALSLVESWGANILIDEADVFLEKRDNINLKRNAVVSIFLKTLEKYNGKMFLTTNRITEIDEAFASRVTMIFEYNELNEKDRFEVFSNLLRKAKIDLPIDDIVILSKLQLNGREIKNLIRLVGILAFDEKVAVSISHFNKIIRIMKK